MYTPQVYILTVAKRTLRGVQRVRIYPAKGGGFTWNAKKKAGWFFTAAQVAAARKQHRSMGLAKLGPLRAASQPLYPFLVFDGDTRPPKPAVCKRLNAVGRKLARKLL